MRSSTRLLAPILFLPALILGACGTPGVEEARRSYAAEVTNFIVRDSAADPMAVPVTDPSDGAALDSVDGPGTTAPPPDEIGEAGETTAPTNEGEDAIEPTEPLTKDVVLDILVTHDGKATLPGLTLDITQGTGDGDATNRWTAWVDTAGMAREARITHTLRGVSEVGPEDWFAAEVAHTVPKAQRGEYREFAGAGDTGN